MILRGRRQSTNVIDLTIPQLTAIAAIWVSSEISSTASVYIDTDGLIYHLGQIRGGTLTIGMLYEYNNSRSEEENPDWFPTMTNGQKISLVDVTMQAIKRATTNPLYVLPPTDERDIEITSFVQAVVNNTP